MPWKNNRELLKAVDKLPHGPDWTVQAIKINGANGEEVVEMWMRNSLSILRQILGNKRLGQFIEYKVIKKWTSPDRTERIRDEFTSADFMWEVQVRTSIEVMINKPESHRVVGQDHGRAWDRHIDHHIVGRDQADELQRQ